MGAVRASYEVYEDAKAAVLDEQAGVEVGVTGVGIPVVKVETEGDAVVVQMGLVAKMNYVVCCNWY
jgi:hypothetical protein